MSYITVENLNYFYPGEDKKALDNINLKIEKGAFVLVTGRSGSGKSTLARCITGSIPNFYGGRIGGTTQIDGRNINDIDNRERAKEITMVFQDPEKQLMANVVHREIAFGLENVGIEENKIKRRVWEALEFTNLLDLAYRKIDTLSGGEKQKVAVASALSYMPGCIILDEPTSQLDPASAGEIVSLLKKINDELSITVVVIEQRIEKWFSAADSVVIMDDGRIEYNGSKSELYGSDDDKLLNFLPVSLRLSKRFGIEDMPGSFKDIRNNIAEVEFEKNVQKVEAPGEALIEAKNVHCFYGNEEAVKGIDFCINKGDFIGLIGSNGAGKSTVMKSIMGLVKYKGSIKLSGREISKCKITEISKHIGYVSQNPNDYLSKDTVYEELKFTLDNMKIKDYSAIDETLKALGIYKLKDKNPRDLSGGERQRAAVASIMVLKPDILMLDEPTRGLDSDVKKSLGQMLKRLNENGMTIIMITHDMDFAGEFCRKFMLMFNGEVVSSGNAVDVLQDGIFYTTAVNKLLRGISNDIFTFDDACRLKKQLNRSH